MLNGVRSITDTIASARPGSVWHGLLARRGDRWLTALDVAGVRVSRGELRRDAAPHFGTAGNRGRVFSRGEWRGSKQCHTQPVVSRTMLNARVNDHFVALTRIARYTVDEYNVYRFRIRPVVRGESRENQGQPHCGVPASPSLSSLLETLFRRACHTLRQPHSAQSLQNGWLHFEIFLYQSSLPLSSP